MKNGLSQNILSIIKKIKSFAIFIALIVLAVFSNKFLKIIIDRKKKQMIEENEEIITAQQAKEEKIDEKINDSIDSYNDVFYYDRKNRK